MNRFNAVLVVLLIACSAASAAAQNTPRERFLRGQAAYAQGDYEAAVTEWTAAFAEDPRPLLQYNLAQAYERLGRLVEAKAAYEAYVSTADPTDANLADARARASALRERLGRTGVRITGAPEGATILVDGTDHGRAPRPDAISVAPGSHQVLLTLNGYEEFRSTVVVPAGQTVDIPVEMRASADGSSPPAVVTPPSSGGTFPVLPVALIAGGGGVAVLGAVLGGVALSTASSAPSGTSPQASDARGLALGADICIGVGAAAAIVGVVLLILDSGSSGEAAPARATMTFSPIVGPTTGGVGLTGSF